MASLTTNILDAGPARLHAAFDGFIAILERIAKASPHYRMLQHYNSLSDAELAEMGMTRADVVERVFGPRIHY